MRFFTIFAISFLISLPAIAVERIAVVDTEKILAESRAVKAIEKQVKAKRDQYQKQISAREKDLKGKEKALTKQRGIISKEEFTAQAEKFKSQVLDAQTMVQGKRKDLEAAFVKARKEVLDATQGIIKSVAQERGFTMAVPATALLYHDNSLDITDEVVKRLNKKLPSVSLDI